MSYPPSEMINRWENRSEPNPGQGQLYWHILFKDDTRMQALAAMAQEKLMSFAGLHLTPKRRLHMTVMFVGLVEDFTAASIADMIACTKQLLFNMSPITITASRVLYHPEAVVLGIQPVGALDALFKAIRDATRRSITYDEDTDVSWVPHVTLAYSTAVQPTEPIIAALGHDLPSCKVTVRNVDLVVQEGPERLWKWHSIAEVPLGIT